MEAGVPISCPQCGTEQDATVEPSGCPVCFFSFVAGPVESFDSRTADASGTGTDPIDVTTGPHIWPTHGQPCAAVGGAGCAGQCLDASEVVTKATTLSTTSLLAPTKGVQSEATAQPAPGPALHRPAAGTPRGPPVDAGRAELDELRKEYANALENVARSRAEQTSAFSRLVQTRGQLADLKAELSVSETSRANAETRATEAEAALANAETRATTAEAWAAAAEREAAAAMKEATAARAKTTAAVDLGCRWYPAAHVLKEAWAAAATVVASCWATGAVLASTAAGRGRAASYKAEALVAASARIWAAAVFMFAAAAPFMAAAASFITTAAKVAVVTAKAARRVPSGPPVKFEWRIVSLSAHAPGTLLVTWGKLQAAWTRAIQWRREAEAAIVY